MSETELERAAMPTKVRHTPGPWEYLESQGGAWFVYPPPDSEGKASPIRPRVRVPKRGTKEMVANARLIAAGPTMYDYIQKKAEAGDAEAQSIIAAI